MDWLDRGGGSGCGTDQHAATITELHRIPGSSRFTWFQRANDDHAPNTINHAGFNQLMNKNGESISMATDFHKRYGDRIYPEDSDQAEIEYLSILF